MTLTLAITVVESVLVKDQPEKILSEELKVVFGVLILITTESL